MKTKAPSTRLKLRHLSVSALAFFIMTVSVASTAPLLPSESKFSKAQQSNFAGPLQTSREFDRLIIKFKDTANTKAGSFNFTSARNQVSGLSTGKAFGEAGDRAQALSYLKSVNPQTHVALTPQKLSRAELFALAKQIEQDPRVAYAEIDERAYPSFVPNDPGYQSGQQWHYLAPSAAPGGANLPAAWDRATGAGVVVSVIDTGYRPHVDLAANILPGFDFISDVHMANDGDARDPDAQDPGDWMAPEDIVTCGRGSLKDSGWHGTHVAGTIAAVTNNGIGVAGVAFNAKVLPVRVLGKCGGFTSDIAAGMLWSAGISVPGAPDNPNKAKILNLSLGGGGPCSETYQDAINAIRRAGSVVIAATGNNGTVALDQPSSCKGVIAVTAHTKLGDHTNYGNIGAGTTLSGPGGGHGVAELPGDGDKVYSTFNTGLTAPGADDYAGNNGTSMATPHVAGVAALLVGLQPALSPDNVSAILVASARPHPAGTLCAKRNDCGAGLLDANAALDRLQSLAPSVTAATTQPGVFRTGSTIELAAKAQAGSSGNTTFSYLWTQTAGPAVTLINSQTANTSFVAPEPGDHYDFTVQVTDGAGLTSTNVVNVQTNTAPVLHPILAKTVVEGRELSFTVTAVDAEKNPVVFLATDLPAGATLDPAGGAFMWKSAGPIGNYKITITPNDGISNGDPLEVSITVVNSVNTGDGGGGSMNWLELLALSVLAIFGWQVSRRRADSTPD